MIGDTGRKAEKKTAKRTGLKLTAASGAMEWSKGDMEGSRVLVENKSTVTQRFVLSYEHLKKINTESQSKGKAPALTFQFTTGDGKPRPAGSWVAIPEWLAKELGVFDADDD